MVGPSSRTRIGALVALSFALALSSAGEARAQVALGPAQPVEARVWLDRGDEPTLQRGDRLRIYYRSVLDAYIAIFQIDTDGTTRLVFPLSPSQDHYARGGRDYRVLFPGSAYWQVADQPGVGYFFIVASPEPFDFSSFRFSPYRRAWDLSYVGEQVYRDPYVAMDDYVAALIPDWQTASYALDFTAYHVGERYEYPRFLCYECHGFRQYASWNPYYEACTTFRVVIYDDPYFYPARRYRSDRVVWTQPVASGRPRFAFKERAGGEPAGPLIQARTSPPPAGVLGPAPRRDPANGAGGVAPSAAPSAGQRPTNLGVIRGRPSAPATATGAARDGSPVTAPSRSGERQTGVVAPSPRGNETTRQQATPQPEPARVAPSDPDERLRPVLRKRPSEETARPAPAEPARGSRTRPAPATPPRRPTQEPAEPERQPATTAPQRRPDPASTQAPAQRANGGSTQAPPRRGNENPPARPQNGGGTAVAPRSGSGGGSPPPVVRRTPDGRPVVRRDP